MTDDARIEVLGKRSVSPFLWEPLRLGKLRQDRPGSASTWTVVSSMLTTGPEAIAIPVEQLENGPTPVAKAKQMTGERIELQRPRNQDG